MREPSHGDGSGPAAARARSADLPRQSRTILITGVMAAGKSTVAQLVAGRLPRSVHLRGDAFRRMIVNGRAELGKALSDEAMTQLRLRYELAAGAARGYLRAGFDVVYQDVVLGVLLPEVLRLHARPLHVVVLCPAPAAVAAREAARAKVGYRGISVADLDRALREETPRVGLWLDSTDWTAEETADRILAGLEAASVGASA